MNLAQASIEKKVISWMLTLILLIGGVASYFGLGQLEDPEFTLKQAIIITAYPGASPQQVEEEVTYPIENALQQLPYVDHVTSISSPGLSQITVDMKSTYRKEDLRQIWDELRRKVNDLQNKLPSGVQPSSIMDDFGDVYGILLSVTGEGYSYDELRDYVDYLRRELVLVNGVGKVSVAGEQQAQVVVEIASHKLSALGIPLSHIFQLLETQNSVSNAGRIKVGSESIRFHPTGEFKSVDELENLLISQPGASKLVYLGDVASVHKSYQEVPQNIINYNGKQALLLGVSFSSGVNVVDIGDKINQRLQEIEYQRPIGMEISTVYNQPNEVNNSVSSFIISLAEAVVIVIVVLLIFMGLRSGVLIGLILLLTVLGSFIFMKLYAIDLQRISLGALIIALGMLVDNAIVITEGILIGLKQGKTRLKAAVDIVQQTRWPLLGATIIAITAFAPIGLSSDATGEFAGSLFYVLLISLLLSWVTAITLTPFFASLMFKEEIASGSTADNDPYQGVLFVYYKKLLDFCMRFRWLTLLSMIGLLVVALMAFGQVKQSFFPASNTPMFYLDYWRYQGSDIRETQKDIEQLQSYLAKNDKVTNVTSTVGQGAPRFMLTYAPKRAYASYGQLIVRVKERDDLQSVMGDLRDYANKNMLNAEVKLKRMEIGPSTDAKIEARFIGPDPDVLRELSLKAKAILAEDPKAFNIRDNWRQRSKIIRPQFNEAIARRLGISKSDLDTLLLSSFTGMHVGLYRDGTHLLPIVARLPEKERLNVDSLSGLQIYSPAMKVYVPITQVVDGFITEWEDSLIMRRDRKRTLTVMADHDVLGDETAAKLFQRVRPKIEAIPLPHGYTLEWGGEFESSSKAQKAIFGSLPLGYLTMFLITVLLFNAIRAPLVIWATVPLAVIGVAFGLLIMNASFSFMALLGLLSLSGMLIKNGIVLVDQINLELDGGKQPYQAVVDSGVSRVRPVSMAAITTILGMIPLLFDVFFKSMAVTIMFGLGFATILTLIIVPVLYAMIHRIPYGEK
ncbi:efflux RND transporter permease subunit [Pleionea sp. CnH1-48]|uniref:efflux RND transporter permease subunit n=1 Tax=Pleionea sp. CnH1-48 TaxID=2954494 RepID=UPI0020980853|nr:efflux RND transporter permease subunit [Pleionea sp. CnH1-48]MCO7225236.1 efflux RND transporter permease subunit [Pleionea sp. CnH1-48]